MGVDIDGYGRTGSSEGLVEGAMVRMCGREIEGGVVVEDKSGECQGERLFRGERNTNYDLEDQYSVSR